MPQEWEQSWAESKKNTSLYQKYTAQILTTLIPEQSALPVNKQIFCQPFGANDFKYDLIGLKSLEVNSAGQSWVQTLGEAFPDDQPLRQQRVAEVTLQSLKERLRSNWCF